VAGVAAVQARTRGRHTRRPAHTPHVPDLPAAVADGKSLESSEGEQEQPEPFADDADSATSGQTASDGDLRRMARLTRQAGSHWFEPSTAHLNPRSYAEPAWFRGRHGGHRRRLGVLQHQRLPRHRDRGRPGHRRARVGRRGRVANENPSASRHQVGPGRLVMLPTRQAYSPIPRSRLTSPSGRSARSTECATARERKPPAQVSAGGFFSSRTLPAHTLGSAAEAAKPAASL
jgi:hypothetical protein